MSNLSSTSDDILSCARSLVIEGGYNGFSYADISKVVGIRKASIHHHFPSKVDLVRTLVQRYREEAEAAADELRSHFPEPADQLRAYAKYWETCISDGSRPFCVCALLASEIPALPEDVGLEVTAHFRMLSAWVAGLMEQGAEDGTLQLSGPPQSEAEAFIATVHGAMLSARAYGDPSVYASITHPLVDRLISR
ncbi:TetR/AcrR family transcriptional regulator [Rhodobacterales bacterium]|nr:TetR/AcrR family transcriptional regulator [Rhodobacterales bacterium]